MRHYIKFLAYNISIVLGCMSILLGDFFIILGFIAFVSFYTVGDAILGNDLSKPSFNYNTLLNGLLYSSVPTTLFLFFCIFWITTPYQWAFMGALGELIQYDFNEAKANTSLAEFAFAIVFCGLMLSGVATVVGHELIHRIGNKKALITGRWLLAASLDANFSIEHVFGHHIKVATQDDPATAPRGRNVYHHVLLALYKTNQSAWQIEIKRLKRKDLSIFSLKNQCIRGWCMSIFILALAFIFAGIYGALFVFLTGFISKCILEIVNYMEHYGLVRHPRQRVEPRHSWNSNKKISCWAMFNLPRHSHHHAKGTVPFEKLESMPDAPEMISGYISTMVIVLIPPLWFKVMAPKLRHWDLHYANTDELAILKAQETPQTRKPEQALI
jgi:alkane 1-monooxygenase